MKRLPYLLIPLVLIAVWLFPQQRQSPTQTPATADVTPTPAVTPMPDLTSADTTELQPSPDLDATPEATAPESKPPKLKASDLPAVISFLEIPPEHWEEIPADCLLPLEAIGQEFSLADLQRDQLEFEQQEWNLSRGIRENISLNGGVEPIVTDNDGYSQDTLEQLAGQGDMIANQMLGEKMLMRDKLDRNDYLQMERYLTEAVVMGSTRALDVLAAMDNRRQRESGQSNNEPRAIQAEMDAVVWTEIARKRGGFTFMFDLMERHHSDFSDEQWQQIQMKADGLYQSYQAARDYRGLPEFDNELPVLTRMINRFYDTMQNCAPELYDK